MSEETQIDPKLLPENAGRSADSIRLRPVLRYPKPGRPKSPLPPLTHAERQRRYAARHGEKHTKDQTAKAIAMQKREGIGLLAEAIAQFPGGMRSFLPFVRACALKDVSLQPLVDSFFNLGAKLQSAYQLEQMCRELEVNPHHLLGVCVEVASEQRQNISRMLTYLAMPAVTKRNIIEAKKPKGIEDRRMFMQSTGQLPVPKGSTINLSATAQAATMTNDGAPTGLSAFEDSTVSFSEIIRNAVEVPKALPEPVEAVMMEE